MQPFSRDPVTRYFSRPESLPVFFKTICPILLKGKDVDIFFYEGDKGVAIVGDIPTEDEQEKGVPTRDEPSASALLGLDDEDVAAMLPLLDPSRGKDWRRFGEVMKEGKKRCVAEHGQHRVLGFLAVDPESQGLGIGSALLKAVIADTHERGLPVFLESSSSASARLYARSGFRALRKITFGDQDGEEGVASVRITLMATSLDAAS